MSAERDDVDADAFNDWLRHPATRKVCAGLSELKRAAFVELLGSARASSDAAVRKAIAEYDAATQFLAGFQPVEEGGEEDGESSDG